MDRKQELQDLKRRVSEIERAVNLLGVQLGAIHLDAKQLGDDARIRFDTLDGVMLRVVARLDTMNTQVWSLRDDMPLLVADALSKARQRLD